MSVVYLVTHVETDPNGVVTHFLLYIGETDNLKAKFKDHFRQKCFQKYEANRLCTLMEKDQRVRIAIENDLLENWTSPCNVNLGGKNAQNLVHR